jgi:drug/metabolite transporter superfamily protein YnfA
LRRFFAVIAALVLAVAAGALFLAFGGLAVPATREFAADIGFSQILLTLLGMANGDAPDRVWGVVATTFWLLASAILVIPPVVAAMVGEAAGLRSFAWYGGASGLLAAGIAWLGHPAGVRPDAAETKLLLLLFVTGAVAGLVYWAIAGRTAGSDIRPPIASS